MSDLFKADEEDEDVKTFVPASKHQDEKREEKEPVKENATAVSVNTDIADEAENTGTSDDDDQIEAPDGYNRMDAVCQGREIW